MQATQIRYALRYEITTSKLDENDFIMIVEIKNIFNKYFIEPW